MTLRTAPPFRADLVGSLLRPPALSQAREDHSAGRIDAEELRAVEDDAIRDAVRLQEDVGLRSATDGEFRRASWHMDFIYQLGGISQAPGHIAVKFRNPTMPAMAASRSPSCGLAERALPPRDCQSSAATFRPKARICSSPSRCSWAKWTIRAPRPLG